jgi:hypothetical protein
MHGSFFFCFLSYALRCHSERSPARFCFSPGFQGRGTEFEGPAVSLPLQLPKRQAGAPHFAFSFAFAFMFRLSS